MTTATTSPTDEQSPFSSHVDRPVIVTVFALLIVGLALRAAFFVWHPPFDSDFYDYAVVQPIREAWFLMHFFAGAPGSVLTLISFGILAVLICRGRRAASVVALIGAIVGGVGALYFALGLAAEGAAWAWATNPNVIDLDAGAALLRGMEGDPVTTTIIVLSSVALIPLGVLLMLIGVMLSKSLPLWLPIAAIVVLILGAVLPPLPGIAAAFVVLQSAALIAIGLFAVRPRARVR